MATAQELQEYKRFVVAYGGGYLRNARWSSQSTCDYCAGVPGNPDFDRCYQCAQIYSYSADTSDLRGFVFYGWDGGQSATVMYGYKARVPNRQAYRVVNVMLFYALHEHMKCAADQYGVQPSMWATVPSLKQRGHPQALHTMAAGLLRNMPEANMQASATVQSPRDFRPENFAVTSAVSGQHVLLLDDTWVSGGHAESAAAALKRAGAARVTILVLARWLIPQRGETSDFIKNELTQVFDPDLCPFDRC